MLSILLRRQRMERTPAVHSGRFCKILSKKYEGKYKRNQAEIYCNNNYSIEGSFKLLPLNKTLTETHGAHDSEAQ